MSRSIMQNTKECFLCRMRAEKQGYFGPLTSYGLEKHHVMHGVANRKIAEKYGLTVYLCEKTIEQERKLYIRAEKQI